MGNPFKAGRALMVKRSVRELSGLPPKIKLLNSEEWDELSSRCGEVFPD